MLQNCTVPGVWMRKSKKDLISLYIRLFSVDNLHGHLLPVGKGLGSFGDSTLVLTGWTEPHISG